jgi:hypothetical protein
VRQAELREGILVALEAGPVTESGLRFDGVHSEILTSSLRALAREGRISKDGSMWRLLASAAPAVKAAITEKAVRIERSAAGLREALFDAIDGLRSGKLDVKQSNAIATAAGTILKSIDTQVAFERLRLDKKIPGALGDMPLVSHDPAK